MADSKWHLTSPTPYDTPLTYGGWTQSRALGVKIASVLQNLDAKHAGDLPDGRSEMKPTKRKHKIVIHTSPFLRCIQTAIGIASGLATSPAHSHHARRPMPTQLMHSDPARNPPTITARSLRESPRLEPIPEPASSPILTFSQPPRHNPPKALLRIDAFLGEWLSPEYFMHITPPPSSVMMVASAKADLLRREDCAHLSYSVPVSAGGFPGGWSTSSNASSGSTEREQHELPDKPFSRDRTSSMSSAGSGGSAGRPRPLSRGHGQSAPDNSIYAPPIPHYALSMSDPIPLGYVSHAKDAVVMVDYQWDSMREPQNWGDGGDYGEEWSSMHKRFRTGITKLIDWYREHDVSVDLTSRPSTSSGQDGSSEDEEDLVVIVVSHGAGCNALIGAITNQPVLLDVGMTNLTVAVRKTPKTPHQTPNRTLAHSRNQSRQMTLADEYDLILQNSSEHLRRVSGASTQSSNFKTSNQLSRPFLDRLNTATGISTNSPFVDPISIGEPARGLPLAGTGNPNFGSIRRTASVTSGTGSSVGGGTYTPSCEGSIGLWAPKRPVGEEEPKEEGTEGDDMVLNFALEREVKASQPTSLKVDAIEDKLAGLTVTEICATKKDENKSKGKQKDVPERSDTAKTGLWPGPRPPGELGTQPDRLMAPKRRWTVTENPGR